MQKMQKYKEKIDARVAEELDSFVDLAVDFAKNPELGDQEFATSRTITEALAARGWAVEYPYAGLPTAFNATIKKGDGPIVAFLTEYDALPEIGHACGHNLNAVMSMLGGIALADALGADLAGEIRIVGTPAEETNGAKVEMANRGVFDDVDFAMMVHAAAKTTHPVYRSLAMDALEFSFKGKTSHAAATPWEGLNALNGVQLFFHAVDMLRQHVLPTTRIHGIITKGGEAPNIVPDFAQAAFYFRSPGRRYLNELMERVYDCARGAALATGTQVSWRNNETSFSELLPNPEIERRMMEVLDELNIAYDTDEYRGGSTDAGNVSWRCPTMHLGLAYTDREIAHHTTEFAELAGDAARIRDGISNGARANARMGLLVLQDREVRERMRADYERAKEA